MVLESSYPKYVLYWNYSGWVVGGLSIMIIKATSSFGFHLGIGASNLKLKISEKTVCLFFWPIILKSHMVVVV